MSLIQPDLTKYTTSRAASGSKSLHNGDIIAIALLGMTVDEVKEVADSMGVEDTNKYDALNIGQQRMNLGNRIRGRVSAINKANAALEAKAEHDDATKEDVKAAKNLKSGEDQLDAATKVLRKDVDKRLAEEAKAKTAKAKEAADAKTAKAKAVADAAKEKADAKKAA